MKFALELEVPDEQAVAALQWLQNIPNGLVAKFSGKQQRLAGEAAPPTMPEADKELSEAEQKRLLHELFGAWKSGVSGEEMVREIYEARQSDHRDVEL